jgi:DNA-binding NtrC family response regulator
MKKGAANHEGSGKDLGQGLRVPVDAIVNHAKELLKGVGEEVPDNVLADLRNIHTAGMRLRGLVHDGAGSAHEGGSDRRHEDRASRHDMRTTVNAIIGYSELLMEDAEKFRGKNFLEGLQGIHAEARRFLESLEDVAGLPLVEAPLVAAETQKGSILIVDDNEANRDLLSRQLEKEGHAVTTAENGRRALKLLGERPFDLLLLDIMMPEMDGHEVLQHLKSDAGLQDVPVVVISALEDMESVARCIRMGAEDYLLKPFNPVLLEARIRTCLEKKRLRELSEALELRQLTEGVHVIAESRVMQNVLNTVRSVSRSPVNVLLRGESGTGKEVIARMIHRGSDRRDKPFVAVNCASIPENLMESEFFGYEKGAFTGAVGSRGGRFEEANGGTLFLDEIGDMPLSIQPKFLRVLQEGEGSRLGSNKPLQYDLRVISAVNRDIRKEVAEGRFREDLFYRIFSVEVDIPPLRERREDIVPLALFFISMVQKRFQKRIAGLPSEVLAFFEEYHWPGNVRQLLHEVERLVALTPEGEWAALKFCSRELSDWRASRAERPLKRDTCSSLPEKVTELEITCIREALRESGGKKVQAAKLLGITRQGLDKKMKRYGIS